MNFQWTELGRILKLDSCNTHNAAHPHHHHPRSSPNPSSSARSRSAEGRIATLGLTQTTGVTVVHSLTLDFPKDSGLQLHDERPGQNVRVLLYQLDTLIANFGYRMNHYEDIEFLPHLDMPNLKQLRLRVHYSTFSFSNRL